MRLQPAAPSPASCRSERGSRRSRPIFSTRRSRPSPLQEPHRCQRPAHPPRERRDVEEQPALQADCSRPGSAGSVFAMCMRNGSISLPYCTPEGQADSQARQSRQRSRWPADVVVQLEPAVGHGPHEVDAAARAVGLVAQFDIGGTGRGTETAVDAVQEQLVVDARVLGGRGPGEAEGIRRLGSVAAVMRRALLALKCHQQNGPD